MSEAWEAIVQHSADSIELFRMPGLFRRWELGQLLEPGRSYHLEDAGVTREGTQLLAIYRGERAISNRKADAA